MSTLKRVFVLAMLAALALANYGCTPEEAALVAPVLNSGSANFAKFVALGNSLSAGFVSGGLVDYSQRKGFPALIARQLGKTIGTAGSNINDFHLPLVAPPGAPPVLKLTSLAPLTIVRSGTSSGTPSNTLLARPYDNLAVPGAFAWDVKNATSSSYSWSKNNLGSSNAAFDLVLRNPNLGNTTALQQAALLNPTFISLWIGSNDALGAAANGITQLLTPAATFNAIYSDLISSLKTAAPNAKMVVANVPDVTSIPFVTTLPPVVLNPQTNQPVLVNGAPVPLLGEDGDATSKQLSSNTYVLLTAKDSMAVGVGIPTQLGGTGRPLSTRLTLSPSETAAIQARIAEFNTTIRTVAAANGIPVVDAYAILNEIKRDGVSVGGVDLNANFITGGIFSLDGVHPTVLGHGIIANAFIEKINEAYGSNIPGVNLEELFVAEGSGLGKGIGRPGAGNAFLVPGEVFDRVAKLMAGSFEY